MANLPVIVGLGGINPAGRTSFHHGYRRLVMDALPTAAADETFTALASLMNLPDAAGKEQRDHILAHTLVRRLDGQPGTGGGMPWNRRVHLRPEPSQPICFDLRKNQLPTTIPIAWEVTELDDRTVQVLLREPCEMLLPDVREREVNAAGQLPTGFAPGELYQSRNHPRGLQMTVFGASDALQSTGISWETLMQHIAPDELSVYAGSAMSQLDACGNGGMMMSRANGKRVTSKQCALGFAEMPADFINAYILGSLGTTGTNMGACASFLYNLRQAVQDIRSGQSRIVIVGNSEAPITPEVMDGYAAMGALATDKELMALDVDNGLDGADHRRACRPFGDNCGFTIAESAQFFVLCDDSLALELGATIYGAVDDVFINADGYKKSISAPGIGNYITVAKALAAAESIVGKKALAQRSFVQAHGTGTPQNRVTESHVLNEAAKAFGISKWPVAAVKCFLGHSIGVAAGDQLAASLGTWAYGVLPGITTIDGVADDVHASNLTLGTTHSEVGSEHFDVAIINAKGFGGNNASASALAPHVARKMLERKHGVAAMTQYRQRNEAVTAAAADYDSAACRGEASPIYKFDHDVKQGDAVRFEEGKLYIDGVDTAIDLGHTSPYSDML